MATTELVTLRHNPDLGPQFNPSPELSVFHERATDKKRDLETYKRRRKAHIDALLIQISTENVEKVYRDFCNELDDCYDTNMLLMICNKFGAFIRSRQEENRCFSEYLFAKLASWSTHEPRMCAYIVNLLNPQQASQEQQTTSNHTRGDVVKATNRQPNSPALQKQSEERKRQILDSQKVLVDVIRIKLNKEGFFRTLNEEHQQTPKAQTVSASRAQTFSTDSDIVNSLISIQRLSGRSLVNLENAWIMKQTSLLKTADDMQSAIKAIDMFAWDSLTREQKFIKKVIDALKASENDTITIQAGVYHRETFTFDRNQLLVLIRSNPALCAEFKKALKQKPGMFSFGKTVFIKGSDASQMFESMDDSFVTHAKKLLQSLTLSQAQTPESLTSALLQHEQSVAAQTDVIEENSNNLHDVATSVETRDVATTSPRPAVTVENDSESDVGFGPGSIQDEDTQTPTHQTEPSLSGDFQSAIGSAALQHEQSVAATVYVIEENLDTVVTSAERHDVSATPLTPAVEEIPSRLLDTSDQQRDVDFVPDAIHHSEDNENLPPADDIVSDNSESLPPADDIVSDDSESLPPADDIVSDDSESLPPADDIVSDDSESLPPADDIVSDENSQDPGDSASQVAPNDHIIDDDKENIPHASEESSLAYLCLSIKALAEHNEVMENTKKKASSVGSFFSNSSVKNKVTHTLSSMVIS